MLANVSDGTGLYHSGPFKVPPELGSSAVSAGCSDAGVAVCDTERNPRYDVCNRAGFWGAARGQCPLNEVEVTSQIAANVVE